MGGMGELRNQRTQKKKFSVAAAFGLLGGVLVVVIVAVLYAVYRMSIHSAMRLGD